MGPAPESWRPDKPEFRHPNPIVGVLLRVVDGPDRGYGPIRIAELRDVDGRDWSVWLLGRVLQEEFERQSPAPGELVAIYFNGLHQGADASYRSYRLVVDRQERAERLIESPAKAQEGVPCEQCGGFGQNHAEECIPF
ncbi:MAG: hypothetical protein ABSC51_00705 [Gaiellaceae bacterium]|jgi:hypothetical protein